MEGNSQRDDDKHTEHPPANDMVLAPGQNGKHKKKIRIIIFVILVVAILLASSLSYYFLGPSDLGLITIYDVAELRGLEVHDEVDFEYMSEEECRERLIEDIDYSEMEIQRKVFESLFLWNPNDNLTKEVLDLYSSGIVGYYDLMSKNIVLIRDPDSETSRVVDNITLSHEYVHALQDQNFNLSEYKVTTSTDAYNARNAVVEGDATNFMLDYMLSLSDDDLNEFFNSAPDSSTESIPYVLDETINFPYFWGYLFISEIYLDDGWEGVNALYTEPPASTEQIMHPYKYRINELPINVSYSASVPGMDLIIEDTLGEHMIFMMLDYYLNYLDLYAARDAAEGWGGDRYYYYESENDFLSIFTIEWDTLDDAEEFNNTCKSWMAYYPQALSVTDNTLRIKHDGATTTIFYSSDPNLIDSVW